MLNLELNFNVVYLYLLSTKTFMNSWDSHQLVLFVTYYCEKIVVT